jgi:flagellar export protein FliJ
MKPFHFALEAVCTVRLHQEQKALESYAQALQARSQAEALVAQVDQQMQECWNELRAHLARGCSVGLAARTHDYQKALAQRRHECAAALELAERRVAAALQGMLHARRQREIVDRYRERQKARHDREQVRAEQKFLDDLAGRRSSSILAWKPSDTPV